MLRRRHGRRRSTTSTVSTVKLLVVVAGLLVAADAKEDTNKDDLKKLEGTWVVVSAEELGKKASDEDIKDEPMQFVFAGGKVKINLGRKKPQEGTFTIDATKKPKQIDMKAGELEIKGIYAFEGDALKMCLVKDSKKERPADFTTKAGDGHALFGLKREKK